MFLRFLSLSLYIVAVAGHAYITGPIETRSGLNARPVRNGVGDVVKLLQYVDKDSHIAAGCVGKAGENKDLGPQPPTRTYRTGQQIVLTYDVGLGHPAPANIIQARLKTDNEDFSKNVLRTITGAPADQMVVSGSGKSMIVQLPAGKTCERCVLQWSWFSQQDGPGGGGYISCIDFKITALGTAQSDCDQPITSAELAKHSTANNCWMRLRGKAYDVSNLNHPNDLWKQYCGKDGTQAYFGQNVHNIGKLSGTCKGTFTADSLPNVAPTVPAAGPTIIAASSKAPTRVPSSSGTTGGGDPGPQNISPTTRKFTGVPTPPTMPAPTPLPTTSNTGFNDKGNMSPASAPATSSFILISTLFLAMGAAAAAV